MTLTANIKTSTLQEWSAFLQVLDQNRNTNAPLLKQVAEPEKLIHHLHQKFEQKPVYPSIFLRYKYGKQLIMAL
jgi:hypothetical protein